MSQAESTRKNKFNFTKTVETNALTKVCSKCGGDPKPISDFYPHDGKPDGVNSWCIACSKAYGNAIHAANRVAKLLPGKVCGSCGDTKLRTEFYRNRSRADGYGTECKGCKKAYVNRPEVRERHGQLMAIVRRGSLFKIAVRIKPERSEPEYPSCFWYKFRDPEKREAARLAYEKLLAPPPVKDSKDVRIDI